ncbi:hypothetical protein HFZ78_13515 [Priestia megaterium]|uniref:Uncharacterized protein n=1 Tax=Priestia megaterium TaxID=1404 RepID=A0A6H1P256_PRIMG|nr:hypothetical protein [Priestia megaterium]QIZ07626.1 hypothetical protein HFZ78_13515 [Priestia megaterium]
MSLLFYSMHQPEQIKIYNSSMLTETELESILSTTYNRNSLRGEKMAMEFRKLFALQLSRGKSAVANYDFFIKNQLVNADIPCIFSFPIESTSTLIETKGIATEFASLKSDKEILEFGNRYGLLGVVMPSSESTDYGQTVFEPLYFWKFYIDQIKKLLKLYKMLKKKHKNQNVDIIGELINYKESNGKVSFEWNEGGQIPFDFKEEADEIDYEQIDVTAGAHIFTTLVRNGLKGAVNVDFSNVVRSEKSEIGFRIKEVYSTNFLLGAIYYDLWELISSNAEVVDCQYKPCGIPFKKFGRKKYCSDSCKTLAYLARKEKTTKLN